MTPSSMAAPRASGSSEQISTPSSCWRTTRSSTPPTWNAARTFSRNRQCTSSLPATTCRKPQTITCRIPGTSCNRSCSPAAKVRSPKAWIGSCMVCPISISPPPSPPTKKIRLPPAWSKSFSTHSHLATKPKRRSRRPRLTPRLHAPLHHRRASRLRLPRPQTLRPAPNRSNHDHQIRPAPRRRARLSLHRRHHPPHTQ